MHWSSFDNGNTIGQTGSESGVIVRDAEHSLGARITLERAGSSAPYSITCGIYGGMVHTRFFASEPEASQQFDLMTQALSEILEANQSNDELLDSIRRFVERHP